MTQKIFRQADKPPFFINPNKVTMAFRSGVKEQKCVSDDSLNIVGPNSPSRHHLFQTLIKGLFLLKTTNFVVNNIKKKSLMTNIALFTNFFLDSLRFIHSPCTINRYLYTPIVNVMVKVRKRSNAMITSDALQYHSPKITEGGEKNLAIAMKIK